MAILFYKKGEKDSLILKETEKDFEEALQRAMELKADGKSPEVTIFTAWHDKSIWLYDILSLMDYAIEEDDEELQKKIEDNKQMAAEKEKAMAKAMGQNPNKPRMIIPQMRIK